MVEPTTRLGPQELLGRARLLVLGGVSGYALFARAMGHQNLPQSSNMCHETTSVNLQKFIGTPGA